MSLHGFNYNVRWSKDFTTRSSPPAGQDDLLAFTVAKAGSTGNPQAYKKGGKYYIKPSSIKVEIKMVKSESWVLSDSKTDKLKKHEQLHYNISALGGRDLERGLKNLSAGSVEDLLAEREKLTNKIQNLITSINKEYDKKKLWGTDHGRTELHQEFWEIHISKLMNDPNGELKSIYYVMQRI